MKTVSQADFEAVVVNAGKPVLVDFYADWCGPCQHQTQILEALETQVRDLVTIVKVDVDQSRDLASSYGVRSIPTLMLFDGSDVVATRVGLTPKHDLESLLTQ